MEIDNNNIEDNADLYCSSESVSQSQKNQNNNE